MADTPPPIPNNRPKSQYVPPPIPTNRPKNSYVAPVIGSLFSRPTSKSASNKPTPTPKPRTSVSDEPTSYENHAYDQNSFNHTAVKADKPKPSTKPSVSAKPSNSSAMWSQSANPSASNGQVRVTVDTGGASKAMFKAAMDKETRSKAMTKEQEKDAAKLGWGVTKNVAKNASMDDFMKASKAASKSSSSGKSGSTAFASSMIKSQASKDQPVMTKDQQKQAAKLSWGIGKNVAKNVSMNDMKKAASFVSVSSSSSTQQQQQPIPAHRPAPTQPPTARARPKPTGAGTSTSVLPPPPSSQGSVPLQASSQPKPAARSAFSLKLPTSDQSKNRLKPTIIRPGASNQKSTVKSNSRSSSPSFDNNNTKKVPPPRPSGGPPQGKKGGPPPRPTSVPSAKQRTSVAGGKPKRPAPKKPTLLEKHGLSSLEITPTSSPVGSPTDSVVDLPPRPGPGHPLYKYIVSQPHAVAQYDYDAQASEDLSFKTEDLIILKRKIDADWYIGRCGNKEGMFPAQFVRVVRDVVEDKESGDWDDLSFPEGAVIKLVERVDGEWYKGEYNGRTGIFPKGYVEEGNRIKIVGKFNEDWYIGTLNGKQGRFPANFVDKVPTDMSSNSEPAIKSVEPHAFVQYDFDAEGDEELSLKAGETVLLLEKIGNDWLKGRYRGKDGIFPKSFVEVIVDLPQKKPQTKTTGVGKARYEFKGETNEDLSFREGDTIELIRYINSEWMVGKLKGKTGQFPVNFIEIITPLPS
ncbi:SH3 domain-containing protein 19 [Holothuria leucospilota]|uniref:SH3 domain-containing protein 19 n=1 Tax=Holothuria leucospilota TaxID=206669 RepID=A0A9Q1BKC3_HOLLE|nr:SH3 domain-containing protein 19 [Holothuria leucospilota]